MAVWKDALDRALACKPQLVICLIPNQDVTIYSYVKNRLAAVDGIVSQVRDLSFSVCVSCLLC